jgi:hypothetical protein
MKNKKSLKTQLGFDSLDYVGGISSFLSDDQLALLSDLAGHNTSSFRPRLSVEDFEDKKSPIFLESRFGKSSVAILKVRLKKTPKAVFQALMWNALYGRNTLRIKHWYVLFHLFQTHLGKNNWSIGLLRVLRLTTEKSGKALDQKLRSVRTIVAKSAGKETAIAYCKNTESLLGISLGTNQMDLDDYLDVSIHFLHQSKPIAPNRIGVGYKDKGNLSNKVRPDLVDTTKVVLDVEDVFNVLMTKTDETLFLLKSYEGMNKKERSQLRALQSRLRINLD